MALGVCHRFRARWAGVLDRVDTVVDRRADTRVAVRVRGDLQAHHVRFVGNRADLNSGELLRAHRVRIAEHAPVAQILITCAPYL